MINENDIITYQSRTIARLEREINNLRQRTVILETTNAALSNALSRALADRDRVFVPKDFYPVEYRVEKTIDEDYLLVKIKGELK